MIQPLISIIVPVYKVEPYLRRCLDSIVNQTYTNLEIILVDDGSPDDCPQICDEYATKDKRIVVIHKENGGLSDARNAGLDICNGEYVSFVDSDDWVANTYIEIMLNAIIRNNAEIAVSNFIRVNQPFELKITNNNVYDIEILTPIQAIKKLWSPASITFIISCAKLTKRSLFNSIRFPKGVIHEDEYTTYKLLYKSSKTVFLDIPLYCYFQRSDSIMGTAKPSSIRLLKAKIEQYIFFKDYKEVEIMEICLKNLCWDLLFAYGESKKTPPLCRINKHELLLYLRSCVTDFNRFNFSTFEKITLNLFSKFPFLYILYRKISPYKIRKV